MHDILLGFLSNPMFAEYNWPMTVISLAASINLLMAAGMFLLCRATNVIMLYAFAMFFGYLATGPWHR